MRGILQDLVHEVQIAKTTNLEDIVTSAVCNSWKNESKIIYISTLVSKWTCMRKHAYNCMSIDAHGYYMNPPTPVGGRIFAAGHAAHWWLQNKVFNEYENFYGWWSCRGCKEQYKEELTPQPKEACACGVSNWEYKEYKIKTKLTGANIKMDGILKEQGKFVVLDFKTIDTEKWFELREPQTDNVEQLQVYLAETGWDKGILYYVDKNRWRSKTFVIFRDPAVIDRLKEKKIDVLAKHEAAGTLPPKHKSCNKSNWMSDKCPWQKVCYGSRKRKKGAYVDAIAARNPWED